MAEEVRRVECVHVVSTDEEAEERLHALGDVYLSAVWQSLVECTEYAAQQHLQHVQWHLRRRVQRAKPSLAECFYHVPYVHQVHYTAHKQLVIPIIIV